MNKKMDNIFTSKTDVLKKLSKNLKKSKIEKITNFTVQEWRNNQKEVLKLIQNNYKQTIIIRSSALGEDSINSSEAGNYASILNVNVLKKNEIREGINAVIDSYKVKHNFNKNNQILIQSQSRNIVCSGVVFTRDIGSDGPYYVINFEEGDSTEGVTKGIIGNTTKIFRNISKLKIPKKWKSLIPAIKEIEKIVKSDLLDIEFGINKNNQIIIFQVRPITSITNNRINIDNQVEKKIFANKEKFEKIEKSSRYYKTIFSDMADWNPAEIIGNNPNKLDFSLYDFLVMKSAWNNGRKILGYQFKPRKSLMVKFGNKPYVDLNASFYSLIPNNIKKKLKRKLLKIFLDKLSKNHFLHDKIEFEIVFSCYDMFLKNRFKELEKNSFSKNEISELNKCLIEFTNRIIKEFSIHITETDNALMKLKEEQNEIKKILKTEKNFKIIQENIFRLLKSIRYYGIIHFSKMARIAFISTIILKSLEKTDSIKKQNIDIFMRQIETPLSQIQNDTTKLKANMITKKEFLKKYGHLRPGTYDITASRYDKQKNFLENFIQAKQNQEKSSKKEINLISDKIKPLIFIDMKFEEFVEKSLVEREKIKFEFTKSLSDVLEIIAKMGKELGFNRNDIANLDINQILNSNNSKKEIKQQWKKQIKLEKNKRKINNKIILPPIISSSKDFEIINYYISKPNFISTKIISSNIMYLNNQSKKIPKINNSIILIENADPGYDWIFTKKPKGLITKYGGVASHMAIRCAEMGLPAAIGCGEILFEKLISASRVMLDCKNNQIIVLDGKYDEVMEIKKALKSMGYIK